MEQIYKNLGFDENSGLKGFDKLENSISLLHNVYLLGSCKEAGIFIKKYPNHKISDIFECVISIYNKRIKSHHFLFLIIHIFETSIRSKIAFILSEKYSTKNQDNCFYNGKNDKLIIKANRIAKIKKQKAIQDLNSFEILNLFTLGDLENIIQNNWGDFKSIFSSPMTYKGQKLPEYGTKEHLLKTFSMIRKARNDIFHNNPPATKQKSIITNIEILLLRLGFNLHDALHNVSNLEHSIKLKYKYN